MKQLITNIYPIAELSEQQIEKAHEKWVEFVEFQEFTDDFIIDDIKAIGKAIGIHIDKIHYSGFYNQGDGAWFEGTYQFNPNWKADLEAYAPIELVVKTLAESLVSIYNTNKLTAVVKQGHTYYCNSSSADIIVSSPDEDDIDTFESRSLTMYLRSFMNWMYRHIEKEYEYQTSLENFKQVAEANDYHFDENGNLRG